MQRSRHPPSERPPPCEEPAFRSREKALRPTENVDNQSDGTEASTAEAMEALVMSFVEELTWRGLVHHVSDPALAAKMRAEPFVLYAGFDPSADSLHIGHLLPVLGLVRAQ